MRRNKRNAAQPAGARRKSESPLEYRYQSNLPVLVVAVIALICATAYVAFEAMTTTAPLRLSTEFVLSAAQAKLFYAAWAVVLATGTLLGVAAVRGAAESPGVIVLEDSVGMLPKASPSQKLIRIRYSDIRTARVVRDRGDLRHIEVRTDNDASNIVSSKFDDDDVFEDFWTELQSRTPGSALR